MSIRTHFSFALVVVAAASTVGCSADDDADAMFGNLGESVFSYTCADQSDAACGASDFASNASPAVFPVAFAVGSKIRVGVRSNARTGNPNVAPVSAEYLQQSGAALDTFVVKKAGFDALYSESSVDSTLDDYVLLHLVDVDSLTIGNASQRALGTPPIVPLSDVLTLTALPASDGVQLAGALDLEWTVADPRVVALVTANPTARMSIKALASGTSTLTVTLAGRTATTTVTVP